MSRRIGLVVAVIGMLLLPSTVGAHLLEHAPPTFNETAPPSPAFVSGGQDADWELVATLPTGNPLTDLDFFTKDGNTYVSAGTLGTGANGGGQTIAQLTEGDEVKPRVVTNHPSASCVSEPSAALGLQHDVEATPKGGAILNTFNPGADGRPAQLLVDATDASGRCHDQGVAGIAAAPNGGLELLDVAELTNPTDDGLTSEIGLTTHTGEAHTVNIDPRRPHIAYAVTSDAVSVADGRRQNELTTVPNPTTGLPGPNPDRFDLDGFEVVDMSSCMNFPAGTTIAAKRDACRPQVFRYRFPTLEMSQGHTNKNVVYGCHELELYPDDRLTCGSGGALIVLDMAGAFDDNGTPTNYADDKPRGTPLPCSLRDSSTIGQFSTGAKITDCLDGTGPGTDDLAVSKWLESGAPSLQGVQHVGSVYHQGRNTSQEDQVNPAFPSTEDIDFNHEAEYSTSRKFLLATDERGGGVTPPGASCAPGADNTRGNGGIHAYRAGALSKTTPATPEAAFGAYARNSEGGKAIYRAPIRTGPQASLCTAHVFQQIPGQNRIFMGWYSQGTQVVDFTENADGTIDLKEAGYFIPANANTWTSHVFKAQRNADGTFTYWGATGDFQIGAQGRSGMDIYKVTLPGPPDPQGGTGTQGAPALASAGDERCATVAGFRRVGAKRKGRGLRLNFTRQSARSVRVDVFRQSKGRSITKLKRVKSFRSKKRSFTWKARGARNGHYVVRFRIQLADGSADLRRIAVQRKGGRFRVRPAFQRANSCTNLVGAFRLNRPVFGGKQKRALFASFRLNQAADVKVTVTRKGKVVRTTTRRRYPAGRGRTLRVTPKGRARGDYKVTISAERNGRTATAVLTSRRL